MDQAIVQEELTKIEKATHLLTRTLAAILRVRADGEDPEGIGAKAERDFVTTYKAIGESLKRLELL